MSEDIRRQTKAFPGKQGYPRPDILDFFQRTARRRGYPPFPIETALTFGIESRQAVLEHEEVIRRLAAVTIETERPAQRRPEVAKTDLPPKSLPGPSGQVDLTPLTGRDGWPEQRDRVHYWHSCAMCSYLKGTVDFVLHDEQVARTPETEAWFCSAGAARLPNYAKGSRPFLDKVVRETTSGCRSDRAKGLALVRLIGNPDTSPYRDPKYHGMYGEGYFQRPLGGTEEEVIRKGWHMCNEISRALVFLCQIAGLPARTLFLFTGPLTGVGGHAVTEIFFDGKWNMVENNWGVLFLMRDGYFASTVELRDDPEIVNARTDAGGGLCLSHAGYTGPISVVPYAIDRTDHYDCSTQPFTRA